MKKSRFTDAQIMAILRQAEDGIPVLNLCREHQMSSATFYGDSARCRQPDQCAVSLSLTIKAYFGLVVCPTASTFFGAPL
jgi:hypothetical protein